MKRLKLFLFYLLSFTWGLPMTLIGTIVSIILLIGKQKPEKFYNRIYFKIGKNWGGVNFGPIFITDNSPSLHTKQHECGHGLQNIVLGPLMPFVVSIPSMIRYWLYEMKRKDLLMEFIFSLLGLEFMLCVISVLFILNEVFLPVYILFVISGYMTLLNGWLVFFEAKKFFKKELPEYDSIWFEKSATKLGKKYFK